MHTDWLQVHKDRYERGRAIGGGVGVRRREEGGGGEVTGEHAGAQEEADWWRDSIQTLTIRLGELLVSYLDFDIS